MKTFKELRSNINEAVYRSGYGVGRDASDIGTNGEIGLYQIGDPGAISALNSFLGAFSESDLLNPIDGLVKLREKLRLSAHFDFDIDTCSDWENFELVNRIQCWVEDIKKANMSADLKLLT